MEAMNSLSRKWLAFPHDYTISTSREFAFGMEIRLLRLSSWLDLTLSRWEEEPQSGEKFQWDTPMENWEEIREKGRE